MNQIKIVRDKRNRMGAAAHKREDLYPFSFRKDPYAIHDLGDNVYYRYYSEAANCDQNMILEVIKNVNAQQTVRCS